MKNQSIPTISIAAKRKKTTNNVNEENNENQSIPKTTLTKRKTNNE